MDTGEKPATVPWTQVRPETVPWTQVRDQQLWHGHRLETSNCAMDTGKKPATLAWTLVTGEKPIVAINFKFTKNCRFNVLLF